VPTLVYLVRHAHHDLLNRVLVGRGEGVGLSSTGLVQAEELRRRFNAIDIAAVQTSPRLRARQTAHAIADGQELPVEVVPAFDELDTGAWTGRTFDELQLDPRWHNWNAMRADARAPSGESTRELQSRVVDHIERVAMMYPAGRVIIVSHAEPIRAAVLHCLKRSLNEFATVPIEPASVTTLALGGDGKANMCGFESIEHGAAL
jgi:broad specificity phosphatase PhoE